MTGADGKPIAVGDLVCVVRPTPCGCAQSLGVLFIVRRIGHSLGSTCRFCGALWPSEVLAYRSNLSGCEPHRLKRIPPLDELESIDETAKEPA